MDHLGIEPRTNQLKAEYSTIELVILINKLNYNSEFCFFPKNLKFWEIIMIECIKWWMKGNKFTEMNFNAISQLLTVFIIVSMGPAVIAYLAYKKAL